MKKRLPRLLALTLCACLLLGAAAFFAGAYLVDRPKTKKCPPEAEKALTFLSDARILSI